MTASQGGPWGDLLRQIVKEIFSVGGPAFLIWHFFLDDFGPFFLVFFGWRFGEDFHERFALLDADNVEHAPLSLDEQSFIFRIGIYPSVTSPSGSHPPWD